MLYFLLPATLTLNLRTTDPNCCQTHIQVEKREFSVSYMIKRRHTPDQHRCGPRGTRTHNPRIKGFLAQRSAYPRGVVGRGGRAGKAGAAMPFTRLAGIEQHRPSTVFGMKAVRLGSTGIDVSEFFFGAGAIGGIGSASTRGRGLTVDEGRQRLDESYAMGITVIDMANSYAGGESERVVGRWLTDTGADALDHQGRQPGRAGLHDVSLRADHIERQLVRIERLGRVDLYLSHGPDERPPAPTAAACCRTGDAVVEQQPTGAQPVQEPKYAG